MSYFSSSQNTLDDEDEDEDKNEDEVIFFMWHSIIFSPGKIPLDRNETVVLQNDEGERSDAI